MVAEGQGSTVWLPSKSCSLLSCVGPWASDRRLCVWRPYQDSRTDASLGRSWQLGKVLHAGHGDDSVSFCRVLFLVRREHAVDDRRPLRSAGQHLWGAAVEGQRKVLVVRRQNLSQRENRETAQRAQRPDE